MYASEGWEQFDTTSPLTSKIRQAEKEAEKVRRDEVFELFVSEEESAKIENIADVETVLRGMGLNVTKSKMKEIQEQYPHGVSREDLDKIMDDKASWLPAASKREIADSFRVLASKSHTTTTAKTSNDSNSPEYMLSLVDINEVQGMLEKYGDPFTPRETQYFVDHAPVDQNDGKMLRVQDLPYVGKQRVRQMKRSKPKVVPGAIGSPTKHSFRYLKRAANSVTFQFISDVAREHCKTHLNEAVWNLQGTLMFVDISGFTSATTALKSKGAVAVSEVINGYLSKLIDCIQNFRGDIVKFAGDALIVIWPVPQGQESGISPRDTQRVHKAADCALALQKETGEYVVGEGLTLRIHIGIHHGPFSSHLVQHGNAAHHYLSGPVLNEIGHLVDSAKAKEVCVSDDVWSRISSFAKGEQRFGCWLLESLMVASSDSDTPDFSTPSSSISESPVHSSSKRNPLIPSVVHDHIAAGINPTTIAELRFLVVLFVSLGKSNSENVQGVCEVARTSGADVIQAMDDDKGLHLIVSFNISHFMDRAPDAAVQLAADLVKKYEGMTIGVGAGECFVGVVGSEKRCSVDILGDAVNMACRMMQHGESSNTRAVFTPELYEVCYNRTKLLSLKSISVKGRTDVFCPFTLHPSSMAEDKTNLDFKLVPIHSVVALSLDQWSRAPPSSTKKESSRLKILQGRYGSGKWTLALSTLLANKKFFVLPVLLDQQTLQHRGFIVPGLLSLLHTVHSAGVKTSRKVPFDFDINAISVNTNQEKMLDLHQNFSTMTAAKIADLFCEMIDPALDVAFAIRGFHFLDACSIDILREITEKRNNVYIIATFEKLVGAPSLSQLLPTWNEQFEVLHVDLLGEEEALVFLQYSIQQNWSLTKAKCNRTFAQQVVKLTGRHVASITHLTKYIHSKYRSLKVYEDESLGLGFTVLKELSETPWTTICPLAIGPYVNMYDRLSILQQHLLKALATIATFGKIRIVPISIVFKTLQTLTETITRTEFDDVLQQLVDASILHVFFEMIPVQQVGSGIALQQLIIQDTILKLTLPKVAAYFRDIAAGTYEEADFPNHRQQLVAARLAACSGNYSGAEKILKRCIGDTKHDEALDEDEIEDICEVFPEDYDTEDILWMLQERKQGDSSRQSSVGDAVYLPFDMSELPYIDNAEYDLALKELCTQANTVAMLKSRCGGCTLEDLTDLVSSARRYIGELKQCVSSLKDSSALSDVETFEKVITLLSFSEESDMDMAQLLEFENQLKMFLQVEGRRLKITMEVENKSKLHAGSVTWGDEFVNGWDPMDTQHRFLVEGISSLQTIVLEAEAKQEKLEPKSVGEIIGKLAEYVVFHFDMEESVMEKHKYPRTEIHKNVHAAFVEKVGAVRVKILAGDVSVVSQELLNFLFSWLTVHIKSEDRVLANWLRDIGLTEDGVEIENSGTHSPPQDQ